MSDEAIPPQEMFGIFAQIGVVVRDLERAMCALSEAFGIGPFRVTDWPPAGRTDMQRVYQGKPADFTARMAFAELGPVELELIQPVAGESIWADFLRERGEGLHHLRFNVPDEKPVIQYLAQQGIQTIQSASGIRPGTCWVNFGTEGTVGFVVEIMKALPGTSGRTPAIVDNKVQG